MGARRGTALEAREEPHPVDIAEPEALGLCWRYTDAHYGDASIEYDNGKLSLQFVVPKANYRPGTETDALTTA